jgi:hypothetical protein
LANRSESGIRQGSFLFVSRLWAVFLYKKCGRSGNLRPPAFLRQLEGLPEKKQAAVTVPNVTAAVFLRNKSCASSNAREDAANGFWEFF